jgi:hypothetical protein
MIIEKNKKISFVKYATKAYLERQGFEIEEIKIK